MLCFRVLLGVVFIGFASGRPFVFGGVFSSHGDTATMIEARDGYALGIDQVNAQNGGRGFCLEGKPGSTGFCFKYDFVWRDDDSDDEKHHKELRTLIEEDKVHFVGGSHPAYADREMEIANDLGRLNYHCCVGPDELYEKGREMVYGIPVSNAEYTKMTIRTLSLQNVGTMAFVYDNSTGFPKTTCEAAMQYADEIGEVQASAKAYLNMTFNSSTVTDDFYETFVQETKELGIQAVIACVFPNEGKKLVDAFHDQQYPLKAFFLTTGPTKKDWVESFKPKWRANNIFSAAQWHRDMKYPDQYFGSTQKYTTMYEKKYNGQHPTYNAAAASAVILTLTEAIKSAFKHCDISKTNGDADELLFNPEAIRCDDELELKGYDRVLRALKTLDMETFFGRVKFNYYNRNVGLDPVTTQIQAEAHRDGSVRYHIQAVMPLGYATRLMNFPAGNPYKEDCKPGFYVNKEDEFNPCLPCEPGESSHKMNSDHCDSCPIGEWTNKKAQSSCSLCPEGTHTEIRGASKLSDCMCKPGYFNAAQQLGVACEQCPVGAVCHGGTELPIPKAGYWANATRREDVYECDPPSICKGGKDVECVEGREGRLCSACSDGYFSAVGVCFECPNAAAIVGLDAGLLAFWYFINVIVSRSVASLEMILGWAQLANIIGDINLNWTKNINLMFGVVNFLDFDVDILEPSCIISWGFRENMITQLILPLMMFGMAFVGYVNSRIALWLLQHKWIRDEGKRNGLLSIFVFVPENDQQLLEKKNATIARFISSVDVTYVTIAKYCLDVFKCENIAGVNVLREDPSVVCAGSGYTVLKGIAFCGLFYVVGYPLFVLWKIIDLRNRQAFREEVNIVRHGFIYRKFENDYVFMPVLIIFRKLFFVVFLVYVNNPAFQLGFMAIVIIASLMIQVYAAPYVDTSMDILCSFLLIVLMFEAFGGLMFYSDNMPESDRQILEWVVIAISMMMLAVFMVIFFNEISVKIMKGCVKDRLRRHRRGSEYTGILGFVRRLSNQHSGNGVLRNSWSAVSFASSTHEAHINDELLETFDARFVFKSLQKKPELIGKWDRLTHILKDHVSDQSEMSYLSMYPEAKFWRKFVRAFPELVDFLAVTDEDTRGKFISIANTLFRDFYIAKKITRLPLMKQLNWRDQAPMAYWLAFADPGHREFFVDLVTEMLLVNNQKSGTMLKSMAEHDGFDPELGEHQPCRIIRKGRSSALLKLYGSRENPFQRLSSDMSFNRSRTADSSMNRDVHPDRSSTSHAPLTPTPSERSLSRLQAEQTPAGSSCSETPEMFVNQETITDQSRERTFRTLSSSGSQNKSVCFAKGND